MRACTRRRVRETVIPLRPRRRPRRAAAGRPLGPGVGAGWLVARSAPCRGPALRGRLGGPRGLAGAGWRCVRARHAARGHDGPRHPVGTGDAGPALASPAAAVRPGRRSPRSPGRCRPSASTGRSTGSTWRSARPSWRSSWPSQRTAHRRTSSSCSRPPTSSSPLREQVFVPAVEAFEVLAPEPTPDPATLGYAVEQVTFPGGSEGVQLAGTLTLPSGPGPHPAIVLMSGSGAQDRDESHASRDHAQALRAHRGRPDLGRHGRAALRRPRRRRQHGRLRRRPRSTSSLATATPRSSTSAVVPTSTPAASACSATARAVSTRRSSRPPTRASPSSLAWPPRPSMASRCWWRRTRPSSDRRVRPRRTSTLARASAERAMPAARDGDVKALEASLHDYFGTLWDAASTEDRAMLGDREAFIDRQVGALEEHYLSDWFRSLLAYDPGARLAACQRPGAGPLRRQGRAGRGRPERAGPARPHSSAAATGRHDRRLPGRQPPLPGGRERQRRGVLDAAGRVHA